MLSVIGAILAIGLLIVVHEAGHYFVARWCKMRVDRFSIGFGPPILKWRRGETDFTIGPIPFGGFVQIHGMTLADEVAPDDDRSYPNRPAWQRFLTILAGPGTNYLSAIAIGIVLFSIVGVPASTARFEVGSTRAGFDATGKLEAGDRILRIDGKETYQIYAGQPQRSLPDLINASRDKPLELTVQRGDEQRVVVITPKLADNEEKQKTYQLGINLSYERESVGLLGAVGNAFYFTIESTKHITAGLYEIVTGKQKPEFRGPVGITDMVKDKMKVGWISVIELMMLLNVYLGLFNLLPLPALDGGRLVFLGYEMATRHRANPRVEATVHMVGIMCLLLLMVLVTYQDIARLF
ncbi:MAG TPA: M50 family metallopeptidase [Kofleriaceae bacterium]|nr:M50 family metallopeptidase [Kofleriaceae bacterium]